VRVTLTHGFADAYTVGTVESQRHGVLTEGEDWSQAGGTLTVNVPLAAADLLRITAVAAVSDEDEDEEEEVEDPVSPPGGGRPAPPPAPIGKPGKGKRGKPKRLRPKRPKRLRGFFG
jgi:hypothetical protein